MNKATHCYRLDFIKIIAIIGVIYLHLSDNYLLRRDYFASGFWWYIFFVLSVCSRLAVPLFIISSGYLTIGKNYSYSQLRRRLFTRLLIPLLFLFVLTFTTDLLVPMHFANSDLPVVIISPIDLCWRFFTQPGTAHFLIVMLGLNLLMPLWQAVFQVKTRNYLLAKYLISLSFVLSCLILLQLSFNPFSHAVILNEWRWLLWGGYFLFGYLFYLEPNLISQKLATVLLIGGLSVGCMMWFIAIHPTLLPVSLSKSLTLFSGEYFCPWIVSASLGAFVLLMKTKFAFFTHYNSQKILRFFSSLTLGIYVWHGIVAVIIDNYLGLGLDKLSFWQRPALALLGLWGLVFLVSILLTLLCSLWRPTSYLVGLNGKYQQLSIKQK